MKTSATRRVATPDSYLDGRPRSVAYVGDLRQEARSQPTGQLANGSGLLLLCDTEGRRDDALAWWQWLSCERDLLRQLILISARIVGP